MRALTEDEKRFCKVLLESEKEFQGQKPLGDVFREFFGIDFFKKEQSLGQIKNSPFTVRLGTKINVKDEVIQKINEAIGLVLLLEKEGMISYTPIETNRIIGEESLLMDCSPKPIKGEYGFLDYFGVNTWALFNSYYYLTNSFKDFVGHKFKTIEDRHHRQTIFASWTAILIAIVTSITSICFSVRNKQIEVIDTQFDAKKELVNKLIYQNDSIIHLMNSHDEDTVIMKQFKNKQK